MIILNLVQGSPEWQQARAKYFTASEAPSMMGASKYMSRSDLLKLKATGEAPAVTDAQQRVFDAGHAAEAAARPILEAQLGEDLFPATGTEEIDGLPLLASFDGIDMMETVIFEHKIWNKDLVAKVQAGELEPHYYWQLEQQLLVSGAEKVIFVCSDGTQENWVQCEYISQPERRQALIAGWKQFADDLCNYVPEKAVEVVEAEPVRELPAITYKMEGLSLKSNLDEYKAAAEALVAKSKEPIETDQDFANAEAMVKVFNEAESKIKVLSDQVLGEVADIDKFVKDLRFIGERIRQARLATDKQVKARKEQIRSEIAQAAKQALNDHIAGIEKDINARLPRLEADIDGAMKGKKTVASLKDAADTEVAKGKIEADAFAKLARANAAHIRENAADFKFLFNDWSQIAFKETEDFKAIVGQRIADYKAQEEQRKQAEEAAKLEAEAKAKQQAEQAQLRAQDEMQREMVAAAPKAQQYMDIPNKPAEKLIHTRKSLSDYEQGYIDGLTAFAYWKDGLQYVGTTGTLLNTAIERFLQEQAA